jgi:hypothetical protein
VIRGWFEASRPAGRFRRRFQSLGTQAPMFDPQLDLRPWLHPQALAQGFGDSDLAFAADGRYFHWNDYNKTGGLLRV